MGSNTARSGAIARSGTGRIGPALRVAVIVLGGTQRAVVFVVVVLVEQLPEQTRFLETGTIDAAGVRIVIAAVVAGRTASQAQTGNEQQTVEDKSRHGNCSEDRVNIRPRRLTGGAIPLSLTSAQQAGKLERFCGFCGLAGDSGMSRHQTTVSE